MDRLTDRMIRADIVLRWSPLLIALLVFLGTILGLGLIGFTAGVAIKTHSRRKKDLK